MKWFLCTLLFIGLSTNASASFFPPDSTNSVIEKGTAQYFIGEGKRLYNEGNLRLAIVKFREALLKDKNNAIATYWLAECHLSLGDYEKARDFCEEAIAIKPDVHKQSANLLGLAYHRLGDLDKAIANYKKAQGMLTEPAAKELKVQFHIDECERAKEMMKNPANVTISNISKVISSAFDDYAPCLSPDGKTFYFVSRRADNKGGGINPADKRYFEDVYVSYLDSASGEWSEPTNNDDFIKKLNSKGFDAISQLSSDGKSIYMTINTQGLAKGDQKPKTRSSDIFVARMNNQGEWNTPKPIGKPVNTIYFEAAPTVTADGRVMYFVSERAGGQGGADIYITYKSGKEWQKPQNLGDVVNTKGQETTVYITPDDKYLFFSSTGHKGMGGYDIYVTTKKDGRWIEPVNLGYPINTVSDETHFVYYPELKKAFYSTFSSTDNKGAGARDIFQVDMSNFKLP